MKRNLAALFFVAILSTGAQAQFGLPSLGGGSSNSNSGDIGAQVETFNKDANLFAQAMRASLVQINGAIGSDTQRAAAKAQMENITKGTNTQEEQARAGTYAKDSISETTALFASAEAKQRMDNLTPEIQKLVVDAYVQAIIAGTKIPAAVNSGKKILEGIGSNPMNISKAIPVKDGLSLYADMLPKIPPLLSAMAQFFKDRKVTPPNPAADAPQNVITPKLP